MSLLILNEGEPARRVELTAPVAEAMTATGVAQAVRTELPGWWDVSPGSYVGVANAGGLQVMIRPKVPIARLLFMMGYARHPRYWRDEIVTLDAEANMPEALADAFLALSRRALNQGLLKGYVTVDESLPLLRGRIRESDQLRRRFGLAIPLEVRYDEFSVDIPENQLLLAAAQRLLRLPGVHKRHRAGLQRLRLQLADVSVPPGPRPTWEPSRLNARYAPALALAEMILDGYSFEQRVGDVLVTGYLLNMAAIFEDFVTVALSEAFRPHGGRSRLQYRSHLDVDEQVPIRPDFVWLDAGRPRVVADAKYKAEKPSGFPHADLYQLLAYCTAMELPRGHLVYAKGIERERTHVVRSTGVEIVAHTLDLDRPPKALLAQIVDLADSLREPSQPD